MMITTDCKLQTAFWSRNNSYVGGSRIRIGVLVQDSGPNILGDPLTSYSYFTVISCYSTVQFNPISLHE